MVLSTVREQKAVRVCDRVHSVSGASHIRGSILGNRPVVRQPPFEHKLKPVPDCLSVQQKNNMAKNNKKPKKRVSWLERSLVYDTKPKKRARWREAAFPSKL